MTTETVNSRPTIAEAAIDLAGQIDSSLVFQSDATDLPDRFFHRVFRALGGKPEVLVVKGTEEDQLPDELVKDSAAGTKWISDRVAPRLGLLSRIVYSLPIGNDPVERQFRNDVVALNRAAKRGDVSVEIYTKKGKVNPRRSA